ncbi:MAG: ATPase, partial [Bacteroidia bacterium]
KNFIKEYFEGNLPIELKKAFEKEGYNREEILNNVYKKAMPSRYLASVCMFVGKNKEHPFIEKVLLECFETFFVQLVNKYTDAKSYKVHTVGSIGFYHKDLFAKVAAKHGYEIGNVIQSPIDGLINYHSQPK